MWIIFALGGAVLMAAFEVSGRDRGTAGYPRITPGSVTSVDAVAMVASGQRYRRLQLI